MLGGVGPGGVGPGGVGPGGVGPGGVGPTILAHWALWLMLTVELLKVPLLLKLAMFKHCGKLHLAVVTTDLY